MIYCNVDKEELSTTDTLIEDNDTSLQFLPRKATVALMFHCLHITSSVQVVCVIEGKCVEIAGFYTLIYI